MYLDHFGFREPPFRITPDTGVFFDGANRGATLQAVLYAVLHDEGIVKVSGEVGSGKTMLCRVLMERLPPDVETIYLANPSLARHEILLAVAEELGLELGGGGTRVLRALQEKLIALYAEGRRVVVLIDEAHAMPVETLEEIRLLSNLEANRRKLLQIVLFGQPELDQHLNTAQMRQLKERITHGFRLAPMTQADVQAYIEFRLRAAGYKGPSPFTARALRRLARKSEGLTRRINILADKALLAAFAANGHRVTEREVKRAIDDSDFYRPASRGGRLAFGALGVAGGAALGFCLAWLVPRAEPDARPGLALAALPAAGAAAIEEVATIAAPAGQAPASASPAGPALPTIGEKVQQRFAATQQWLASAPEKHHAIQLVTVRETELSVLEDFLTRAAELVPEEQLHVYSVKIGGAQHYRAAFGDYPGPAAALAAMRELPDWLKAQAPYYRSVQRMKSQNRQ